MQIKVKGLLFALGSWQGEKVVVFTMKIISGAKADLE